MRVTFVLPGPVRRPSGGPRVVYEYADRLAGRGHEVTVVHSLGLLWTRSRWPIPARQLVHAVRRSHMPSWFTFRHRVNLATIPGICDAHLPDADIVFATWWETSYGVLGLSASKGHKCYLIQGHETWGGIPELVEASYRLGLENIVVSRWLHRLLEELGAKVTAHIPNGIDFEVFRLKCPIELRQSGTVAMMYHPADWKGAGDGLKALEVVRSRLPRLQATVFGVHPRPRGFPEWIRYVENPEQSQLVDIYNRHAVFVSPSWREGFGLPGAESMACGCALVSTDNGGVNDYATDGFSACLCRPRDIQELAANVIRLLTDDNLRKRIAHNGHEQIKQFTWDRAVETLEGIMRRVQAGALKGP